MGDGADLWPAGPQEGVHLRHAEKARDCLGSGADRDHRYPEPPCPSAHRRKVPRLHPQGSARRIRQPAAQHPQPRHARRQDDHRVRPEAAGAQPEDHPPPGHHRLQEHQAAWIRQILPLHHSTNLVEQVYRAVLGERLYGKCILERGHVHTFDKKTYNYQLDDCYHMVAADCSKRNSHAVLAKEKDNAKHVMIFSENNKIVIEEPATRYTRPTTAFTVKTQTGEERMVSMEVVPDQVAHLLEGQVSVSWARGILTVDTPAHRVIYNGKTLDVMNKAVFAAGDQCGLCGDHNRMRLSDIKSSSQCVHTSLLSMAHSYRVNSAIEQCSPLSSSAVERLSNEKAMCASSPSSPLQVSYSSQVTQAKVLRHAVLHRTGQVCFSNEMLPECDIGFIASETMVQEAGFVCLPAAAAEAKDILRRIHLGQDCNELNSMTVTFTTRVRVAKQCTQQ